MEYVGDQSTLVEENDECKQLEKSQIMPTWAATKSLLLSKTSLSNLKTNSAVVAPLLKTPPTNYGALYTALMLTQGISAEIVGLDIIENATGPAMKSFEDYSRKTGENRIKRGDEFEPSDMIKQQIYEIAK